MGPQDQSLNLRLPSLRDQPQLPLKPTNLSSKDTLVVSSTPNLVEPTLTTPSLPSDMEPKEAQSTTSSETHGVPHGENKDISRLLPLKELVSAVFNFNPSTQPPIDQY